jgi:hypothetical protein
MTDQEQKEYEGRQALKQRMASSWGSIGSDALTDSERVQRAKLAAEFMAATQDAFEQRLRLPGCTCEDLSEYNEGDPRHDRHLFNCALVPDMDGWLWYPHDGELENGGVFVNPADPSRIYLLVKGYLCPAHLEP